MDADTKLVCAWLGCGRDPDSAAVFMDDLAERLANRVQLTTDGHRAYLTAVAGAIQAIGKLKADGSVIEFQADLSGLEENTRLVLSWVGKAKVLGPPELKKRVREELEAMMQPSS